jgi:hypothetical protein
VHSLVERRSTKTHFGAMLLKGLDNPIKQKSYQRTQLKK